MEIKELESYSPSHFYDIKSQLKDYVYHNTLMNLEKGRLARRQIHTREQLQERQSFVRKLFIEALGGIPSCGTPLNSRVTGIIRGDGFRIEKVIYESRPDCFVTANLYIPDSVRQPSGALLFLCGHDPLAKQSAEYQTVCQYLVQSGLIVLAMDPVGQGERLSYYENGAEVIGRGTTEHTHAGLQCLATGYPSARYFLHDAVRAIDYLISRPEVDPRNIGVTGNSGGGTQTSMLMLYDERIKAFAPGTFITGYGENIRTGVPQDSEQNWPGLMGYGFDHEDILLSVAPKPVAILAASYDFFPIEGTRTTFKNACRYWELCGEPEKLTYMEDAVKHSYSVRHAKFAADFFVKALEVASSRASLEAEEIEIKLFEPETLWCTGAGQVKEEKADAKIIFDENLKILDQLQRDRNALEPEEKKKRAYQWLREKVFLARYPGAVNLREVTEFQYEDLTVTSYIWNSQERLMNHCFAIKRKGLEEPAASPVIAIWDGGTSRLEEHMEWIRQECGKDAAVFVLNTSGVGGIAPYQFGNRGISELFGTTYKLADDLIRMGDSLCALRTYDVIRMLDMLQDLKGINREEIRIYAHGDQGMYGLLAALLDERIQHITVQGNLPDFSEWVGSRYYTREDVMSTMFPQVLQYFDLSELSGWLQNDSRLDYRQD
ncbi:cephalosporin-C deacetylase-like acetyl esterase [Anaerotaenia torta]|uniref:alpha/beta hydrolase family protein n=1 Tax=Anaerotaenia torta TaxID=433293 RepID=UPI003D1D425B